LLAPDLRSGFFVGRGVSGTSLTTNFSALGVLDFALVALAGLAIDFATLFIVMVSCPRDVVSR
jgi:hypothetical protein